MRGAEYGLADFPGSICRRVFLFSFKGESGGFLAFILQSQLKQDAYCLPAAAKHCTGDVHDGLPATQKGGKYC